MVTQQANPPAVVLVSRKATGLNPAAQLAVQLPSCDLEKQWGLAQVLGHLTHRETWRRHLTLVWNR